MSFDKADSLNDKADYRREFSARRDEFVKGIYDSALLSSRTSAAQIRDLVLGSTQRKSEIPGQARDDTIGGTRPTTIMDDNEGDEQNESAMHLFLQEYTLRFLDYFNFSDAQVVAGYFPIRSEVNILPIINALYDMGQKCALPRVVAKGQPLAFHSWTKGMKLETGILGIPTPASSVPQVSPDVILVPLLAVTPKGHRLGYGGGFYDRTLADLHAQKRIITIGMAYSCQICDKLPVNETDHPLDYIMTESDIITCV